MRSELLSAALQTTSSRHSPRISALSAGVALVPLFEIAPPAVRSRTSVPDVQSHLLIQLSSRISRSRSASHHTAKFTDEGAVQMDWPWTSSRPAEDGPQNS